MQEGISKKSKDIIFIKHIFYLAIKLKFDSSLVSFLKSIFQKETNYLMLILEAYPLKSKELASIPTASS